MQSVLKHKKLKRSLQSRFQLGWSRQASQTVAVTTQQVQNYLTNVFLLILKKCILVDPTFCWSVYLIVVQKISARYLMVYFASIRGPSEEMQCWTLHGNDSRPQKQTKIPFSIRFLPVFAVLQLEEEKIVSGISKRRECSPTCSLIDLCVSGVTLQCHQHQSALICIQCSMGWVKFK